ncbi:hypothetical protein DID75_02010, partial [Candidatus Marinamargulisbacteria bacterium SCGC AG-410-N11]
ESFLKEIIHFLKDHMSEHFEEEEEIMKKNNFSDYDYHSAIHDIFKKDIYDIIDIYEKKPDFSTHIIFKLQKVIDNLIHHIQNVDINLRLINNGNSNE